MRGKRRKHVLGRGGLSIKRCKANELIDDITTMMMMMMMMIT